MRGQRPSDETLEAARPPPPTRRSPVIVPYFMKELVEEISRAARRSKYVDHQSGVSARLSIANYRTMVASARQRAACLGERPAVPRISDLGHLYASSLGKLELDMMGSHQMSERQVLDAVLADAIATVFKEYVDKHGLAEIAEIFSRGVKIEVGDMLPSSPLRRPDQARAARLGQSVRSERQRQRSGPRFVRRVRPRRPLRHRPHQPQPTARADCV